MNNIIRISESLSINDNHIEALYVTASGKLVAEVSNEAVLSLSPFKHITWDVLNEICMRYTEETLGVKHRIIDLMAMHGFMTEGDEMKLRKSIEESITASTSLLCIGDVPTGNTIPLMPTTGEFIRLFTNRCAADEDELYELIMELDAVDGIEIERTTSDLKVIINAGRMNFPALTLSLDDGEAIAFFDTDPPLYQASLEGEKIVRKYLSDLLYKYGAYMVDGIVSIDPYTLTKSKDAFAQSIKSIVSDLKRL